MTVIKIISSLGLISSLGFMVIVIGNMITERRDAKDINKNHSK